MRRFVGPVLVGLGAFLLVAAVLMRFYAYPQLAVAPIDRDSVTNLEATDATLFDTSLLSEITTDVTVATTTRGDVEASEEAGDNTRVYTGTTTITANGIVRSQSTDRAAFDGVSGEAVNCCAGFAETTEGEQTPITRKGLIYKFPFRTEKKDYDFWDNTLRDTVKAEYQKEDQVRGLDVYVFTTSTPPTVVGTREVPGSVVGLEDAAVEADIVYANERTMYVDPVTGGIVNRTEKQKSTLAIDGEDKVTTTEAELRYTDAQVKASVDDISEQAGQLNLLRTTLPLVFLLLGLIALAVGLLLTRRSRDYDDNPAHRQQTTVDA